MIELTLHSKLKSMCCAYLYSFLNQKIIKKSAPVKTTRNTISSSFTYSILFLLTLIIIPSYSQAQENNHLTPITIQLKWYHQFQFAGIYAAEKQGYFAEQGIKVNLLEGGPTVNITDRVTSGQAQFGIGNSSLLVDFNHGAPIVLVSAMFQYSPFIILAREDDNFTKLTDLHGKTLMGETHTAENIAYLKTAGVDIEQVNFVKHTGNIASLAKNSDSGIDATTAYLSHEPHVASLLGIPYKIFSPRDIGINFYGDLLFSSKDYIDKNPKIVNKIKAALIKGWDYALKNQEQMIRYILANYPTQRSRTSLIFEAQAIELLMGSKIIDLGYMSKNRWHDIANVFEQAGLINKPYRLDEFLYQPKETLPSWLLGYVTLASILVVIISLITLYIFNLNRKLKQKNKLVFEQLNELNVLNEKLATYSHIDGLTNIANRRLFDQALIQAFNNAKREHSSISLLLIDLDDFKLLNDNHGHLAGDECLKQIAIILQSSVARTTDTVARYGGEEFAVILPSTHKQEAVAIANKICNRVYEQAIKHDLSPYKRVTLSIGVGHCVPNKNSVHADLISLADIALYQAKKSGKNKVI